MPAEARPVVAAERLVAGAAVRVVDVDLRDPSTVLTLRLAEHPGPGEVSAPPTGDAPFRALVGATKAAAVMNGTFFSLDARPALMGTMVEAGRLVHHVSWRPHGTTFGLRAGNVPVMEAASRAWWRDHWLSLTAGPRLLADGAVRVRAREEGFLDPRVTGVATRSALGYDRAGRRLLLVSFHTPVTLERAAAVMRALGCWQAMNLDGGTSRALAERGRVVVAPGRELTNAIAVYDAVTPAPAALARAFAGFRKVEARPGPFGMADPGPFACGRRRPLQALRAGMAYDFEDWRFVRAQGAPTVMNRDGWLEARGGAIFARWPITGRPPRGFRLSFLTRPLGPSMALVFGAVRRAGRLDGLTLEHRAPRAGAAGEVTLRLGDALVGRVPAAPGDAGRHLVAFEARGARTRVFFDGRLVGEAAGVRYGEGLALGGAGAVKWLLREAL